ncbi:MAG: hypothetical protein Q7U75_16420 [Desulfobacterales bacterium]|nr:hypothetical protein [Desulfobacterales bacterium]
MMNALLTPGDWEFLSAYLDGQLTEAEQRRAQAVLARRADLRQGYEELRRTRAVLRAAPRRRAPRNFTLTPAMVRQVRPVFRWGWAPSFRLASALATFLFVLSFFFRLSPAGLPAMAPMTAPAPLAAQSGRVMQEKTQLDSSTTPPIIIWNDSGRGNAPAGAGDGVGSGPTRAPAAGKAVQGDADPTTPASRGASAELNPPAAAAAGGKTPTPLLKSAAAPALQSTTAAAQEDLAASGATGPILGVAPTGERGQAVSDVYSGTEALGNWRVQAAPSDDASSRQAQAPSMWIWLQAGLAGMALVCGLAAYVLWWRSRH